MVGTNNSYATCSKIGVRFLIRCRWKKIFLSTASGETVIRFMVHFGSMPKMRHRPEGNGSAQRAPLQAHLTTGSMKCEPYLHRATVQAKTPITHGRAICANLLNS